MSSLAITEPGIRGQCPESWAALERRTGSEVQRRARNNWKDTLSLEKWSCLTMTMTQQNICQFLLCVFNCFFTGTFVMSNVTFSELNVFLICTTINTYINLPSCVTSTPVHFRCIWILCPSYLVSTQPLNFINTEF